MTCGVGVAHQSNLGGIFSFVCIPAGRLNGDRVYSPTGSVYTDNHFRFCS